MVERDFYKLPSITKADADFLKAFIRLTGPAELREIHSNLSMALERIATANQFIQSLEGTSTAEKRSAQSAVIEIIDNLHGQIEQSAIAYLEELRQKKTDFINNDDSAILFFHFIAHQYFRTKRIREAISSALLEIFPDHGFDRLKDIVCYIAAVNVGYSLYADRKDLDLIFLENSNDFGFITGDQPVVNLMGTGDGRETKDLALYYPLSPHLSCIVAPKEYELRTNLPTVKELNDLIAWRSRGFLVADSNAVLQQVLERASFHMPNADANAWQQFRCPNH